MMALWIAKIRIKQELQARSHDSHSLLGVVAESKDGDEAPVDFQKEGSAVFD
jgi:hypothetical protein